MVAVAHSAWTREPEEVYKTAYFDCIATSLFSGVLSLLRTWDPIAWSLGAVRTKLEGGDQILHIIYWFSKVLHPGAGLFRVIYISQFKTLQCNIEQGFSRFFSPLCLMVCAL